MMVPGSKVDVARLVQSPEGVQGRSGIEDLTRSGLVVDLAWEVDTVEAGPSSPWGQRHTRSLHRRNACRHRPPPTANSGDGGRNRSWGCGEEDGNQWENRGVRCC
jgi:hypothetical protein